MCARFLFINSACYVKRNHNASLFQLFVCKYVASCVIDSPENHLTINKNVEILKNMHLEGGTQSFYGIPGCYVKWGCARCINDV